MFRLLVESVSCHTIFVCAFVDRCTRAPTPPPVPPLSPCRRSWRPLLRDVASPCTLHLCAISAWIGPPRRRPPYTISHSSLPPSAITTCLFRTAKGSYLWTPRSLGIPWCLLDIGPSNSLISLVSGSPQQAKFQASPDGAAVHWSSVVRPPQRGGVVCGWSSQRSRIVTFWQPWRTTWGGQCVVGAGSQWSVGGGYGVPIGDQRSALRRESKWHTRTAGSP